MSEEKSLVLNIQIDDRFEEVKIKPRDISMVQISLIQMKCAKCPYYSDCKKSSKTKRCVVIGNLFRDVVNYIQNKG